MKISEKLENICEKKNGQKIAHMYVKTSLQLMMIDDWEIVFEMLWYGEGVAQST